MGMLEVNGEGRLWEMEGVERLRGMVGGYEVWDMRVVVGYGGW